MQKKDKKSNRILRKIFSWLLAAIIACIIVNIFLLVYYRPIGWINRENGATRWVWRPNGTFVYGTEGYGIHKVDSRGYVNNGNIIEEGYILVVGASHTLGREIATNKRYSDLMNDMYISNGDIKEGELKVYNIGSNAYYFPDIVNGFKAILSEFPDSEAIVIEIGSTDFSVEQMESSLEQRGYDPAQNGDKLAAALSKTEQLKMTIKETLPVLSLLKIQKELLDKQWKHDKEKEDLEDATITVQPIKEEIDYSGYIKAMDAALSLIRSEYDGEIYIAYHPWFLFSESGAGISYQETDTIFEDLCDQNGIVFLDMGDAFLQAYEENYEVPYGFWNTSMGTGHLNGAGNRVMAEVMFDALQREGE